MHELPLTQEMFSLVIKYAKSNNAKKINSIKLKIGALSTIIPENVKFYFEILSKNTIAEGAELYFEKEKSKAYCINCNKDFKIENLDLICPKCRKENVFIKPDTGFIVKSITID
jgi:hydrogenase nickel incorporation protein HypA/HybF